MTIIKDLVPGDSGPERSRMRSMQDVGLEFMTDRDSTSNAQIAGEFVTLERTPVDVGLVLGFFETGWLREDLGRTRRLYSFDLSGGGSKFEPFVFKAPRLNGSQVSQFLSGSPAYPATLKWNEILDGAFRSRAWKLEGSEVMVAEEVVPAFSFGAPIVPQTIRLAVYDADTRKKVRVLLAVDLSYGGLPNVNYSGGSVPSYSSRRPTDYHYAVAPPAIASGGHLATGVLHYGDAGALPAPSLRFTRMKPDGEVVTVDLPHPGDIGAAWSYLDIHLHRVGPSTLLAVATVGGQFLGTSGGGMYTLNGLIYGIPDASSDPYGDGVSGPFPFANIQLVWTTDNGATWANIPLLTGTVPGEYGELVVGNAANWGFRPGAVEGGHAMIPSRRQRCLLVGTAKRFGPAGGSGPVVEQGSRHVVLEATADGAAYLATVPLSPYDDRDAETDNFIYGERLAPDYERYEPTLSGGCCRNTLWYQPRVYSARAILGSKRPLICVTGDEGATWTWHRLPGEDCVAVNAVVSAGAKELLVPVQKRGSLGLALYRSLNGGVKWARTDDGATLKAPAADVVGATQPPYAGGLPTPPWVTGGYFPSREEFMGYVSSLPYVRMTCVNAYDATWSGELWGTKKPMPLIPVRDAFGSDVPMNPGRPWLADARIEEPAP